MALPALASSMPRRGARPRPAIRLATSLSVLLACATAGATTPGGQVILPEGVRVESDLLRHDASGGEPIAWQGRVRVDDGRVRLLADALRFDPAQARFIGRRIEAQASDGLGEHARVALSCDHHGALVAEGATGPAPAGLGAWRFTCVDGEVAASRPADARP